MIVRNVVRGLAGVLLAWGLVAGCRSRSEATALARGGEAYLAWCAACHGAEGAGDGPLAATLLAEGAVAPLPLTSAPRMQELGREGVLAMVQGGGRHMGRSGAMPVWGPHLGPELSAQVADYALTLPAPGAAAQAAVARHLSDPPGTPPGGRRAYVLFCSGCHGAKGDGAGSFAPARAATLKPADLTDGARFGAIDEAALRRKIAMGGAHAEHAPTMPGWLHTLDTATVEAIAGYVRTLHGGGGK